MLWVSGFQPDRIPATLDGDAEELALEYRIGPVDYPGTVGADLGVLDISDGRPCERGVELVHRTLGARCSQEKTAAERGHEHRRAPRPQPRCVMGYHGTLTPGETSVIVREANPPIPSVNHFRRPGGMRPLPRSLANAPISSMSWTGTPGNVHSQALPRRR